MAVAGALPGGQLPGPRESAVQPGPQLLDQLTALQHKDGSIELAFDTVTGESAPLFRSGTVAWVGLAASTYDLAFDSDRYLKMEMRSANYLLSLQTDNGLIQGGPDVKWVSTEHNLITYVFLSRLAGERSRPMAPRAPGFAISVFTMLLPVMLMLVATAGSLHRKPEEFLRHACRNRRLHKT